MQLRPGSFLLLVPMLAYLHGQELGAQEKRKEQKKVAAAHGSNAGSAARPKKVVITTDRAVVVTREILVKHGYEVVRIQRMDGTQIVYFRRGNMGRGRGKGPVEKMIIRPYQERVVFEAAPRGVLIDINVRLGL